MPFERRRLPDVCRPRPAAEQRQATVIARRIRGGTMVEYEQVAPFTYLLPAEGDMRVPGIVYASEELFAQAGSDQALQQVGNVATLPGIVGEHRHARHPLGLRLSHRRRGGDGRPTTASSRRAASASTSTAACVCVKTNLTRDEVSPACRSSCTRSSAAFPRGSANAGVLRLNEREFRRLVEQGVRVAGRARSGHGGRPRAHRGTRRAERRRRRRGHAEGGRARPHAGRHPGRRQPLPRGPGRRRGIRRTRPPTCSASTKARWW